MKRQERLTKMSEIRHELQLIGTAQTHNEETTAHKNALLKELSTLQKQHERNENARARNEILRDLCGTSAAAARRDMGL